jgi:hypothetical protein
VLNGNEGEVIGFDDVSQRYSVRINGTVGVKKIKADNLVSVNSKQYALKLSNLPRECGSVLSSQ